MNFFNFFKLLQVNEVTKTLFKHASTAELMSKLEPSLVQSIIQPVGLAPKKSVYIVSLSKILVDKYEGRVPSTFSELESLPGVGHKTASVVMSQLFGVPSFAGRLFFFLSLRR
jgi:endonuclease-3